MNKIALPVKCSEMYCNTKKNMCTVPANNILSFGLI